MDNVASTFVLAQNKPPDQDPELRQAKRARIDEEDEDEPLISPDLRYIEEFHGEHASTYGTAPTPFELLQEKQNRDGLSMYAPFADKEEWDLSCWLLESVTKTAADKFLKLDITKSRVQPSFGSAHTWMKHIDQLPTGPEWKCVRISADATNVQVVSEEDEDEDDEVFELWMRDPVDAVQELIGNPALKEHIAYAPERVYADAEGKERRFDEMWTADWWWQTQEKIPTGGTVASVILSTDKTQLSQFRGDKVAYPVYLTLGNIAKGIRRQPSKHASILIGYLPVSKLESFDNPSTTAYRLFHFSMRHILRSMADAGRNGVYMTCADGYIRRVFPILAAYIADHPEQCLVACCKQNRCPRCLVGRDERGDLKKSAKRQPNHTLETLGAQQDGLYPPSFLTQGLQEVYAPFWSDLPYSDIFSCISSDILHQLHQGVFKDHLLKWCTKLVRGGGDNFDRRFQAMPIYSGLRHFTKGISHISQWTAGEHKHVQRVFVAALAGSQDDGRVVTAARALLDFITLAQYHSHTTATLERMRTALKIFHRNKSAFIELEARVPDHFNISKLHSLLHYIETIMALGSLDGLNSEHTERLHIDFAKQAYRGTNHKDYVVQMTLWLQRREATALRESYLSWRACMHDNCKPPSEPSLVEEGLSDSDEAPIYSGAPWIAKKSPHPRVSVSALEESYGASGFVDSLTLFLQEEGLLRPGFHPNPHDRFDVYNSTSLYMPPDVHLNPNSLRISVKATAQRSNGTRKAESPARWDTILFETDPVARREKGGLNGKRLQVAELHVVFRLPDHLISPSKDPGPLAYVHLFRKLGALDPETGMYRLVRATRQLMPRALIIPLSKIVRPCHISPRFGQGRVPSSWLKGKSIERAEEFLLNKYIDTAMFEAYNIPLQ
ncbi:hypothetical protein CONPUDRAFT_57860 [Coniophora puteana RWD-64-598 SS2]|uniref:Zn-finger domain-containing protein n=1 Tax=Coniophora puteana (strain RWD-64-598) TaxID=741705 RepID=A0A5M3MND3_CONPW|nr:uncharacterized protein CONPUDRAFT_57860 [Coniophora puteana RWD-64-598 SS2]EIW80284.1 hypothetical protein CONPUDRAFT_57860 [Coniophora puteana RWD-64-598 SS2]